MQHPAQLSLGWASNSKPRTIVIQRAVVNVFYNPSRKCHKRRHSEDYRSVRWDGTIYSFTPQQAAIVAILWAAWENGTPDVGQETLLQAIDSDSNRVQHLFRHHPAWEVVITRGGTRGSFRLAD